MDTTEQKTKVPQILITIAAFVVVVAGMGAAKAIIVPFLLAAFIAIIIAPPLFWLKGKGLPTWLSLLVVIVGVFIIVSIVTAFVGSSVKAFTQDLPVYEEKLKLQTTVLKTWLDGLGVDTSDFALDSVFDPGNVMKFFASLLNSLGSVLTNGFLILMTVIFMLLEASSMPAKLNVAFGGPGERMVNFDHFIDNVKQYMVIKSLISLATGILVAILLTIIGVDYPLIWGLLAFAFNYIPNIGSIIAAVPAVLLALIQLGPGRAIITACVFLAINVLMGNAIEPRFMGRGLGLSTLVVFLSLIFWGWILGPVGMLLSVPLTITAKMALDSREETKWLAVLLGPEVKGKAVVKDDNDLK